MNLKTSRIEKGVAIATRPGAHHLGDFQSAVKIKAEQALKVWEVKKKQNPRLGVIEANMREKAASGW